MEFRSFYFSLGKLSFLSQNYRDWWDYLVRLLC